MGMPDYPYVTAGELGAARCYNIYARSNPRDSHREMHFSVKLRKQEGGFTYGPFGWLTRNKTTDRFTNLLFQDNRANQHIEFIEWADRFNCVVGDGLYISHANFYMTKPEFQTFLDRAKQNAPAQP